jgi:hypothetical protein
MIEFRQESQESQQYHGVCRPGGGTHLILETLDTLETLSVEAA